MKRRALGILAASLAIMVVLVGGSAWWLVERRVSADDREPRAVAVALTARVALEFEGDPPLSHYYGALSSTKLPAWLRLPVGLVETLIRPGHCDSMARGLVFALKANGIEARQLDLFARTFTHSIVVAFPDGKPLLLDPYQRYVAVFESGGLPEWAKGTSRLTMSPLPGAPPSPQITSHLARDEPVTTISPWEAGTIPGVVDARLIEANTLILGARDGRSDDVFAAAVERRLGTAFDFFGPKYGSGRNQIITVENLAIGQSASLRFEMTGDVPSASDVAMFSGNHCRIDDSGGLFCQPS